MLKILRQPARILVFALPVALASCDSEEPNPSTSLFLLKSIETTGTSWTEKEEYSYNAGGNLAKIDWVRHTPFETTGSEQYIYGESGKIERVIKAIKGLADEEIRYQYDGDKIVVASSYVNDKKISYQFYDYNEQGKLAATEFYSFNSAANGFDRLGENHYTYYPDGNIHEVKKYDFIQEGASLSLNHTKVYTQYLEQANVVDMELVIPGVVMQTKLPSRIEYMYSTSSYTYLFDYEFRSDGLPAKRITTYNDGSTESTVFQYEEIPVF